MLADQLFSALLWLQIVSFAIMYHVLLMDSEGVPAILF